MSESVSQCTKKTSHSFLIRHTFTSWCRSKAQCVFSTDVPESPTLKIEASNYIRK